MSVARGRTTAATLIAAMFIARPIAAEAQWWSHFRAPRSMPEVSELLQNRFPDVPSISTDALADLLAASQPVLLLDNRAADEFDVSHLPGARHAATAESALRVVAGLPADTRIVTYCSIGYRSAIVARALRDAGFRNTTNLDGSIFRWANEDRPLVRDAGPARLVHPFDASWGALLSPALRAPLAR